MNKTVNNLDWAGIADQFDKDGFVVLPNLLDGAAIDHVSAQLRVPDARDRLEQLDALKLGQGIRRQLGAGLPEPIASWPEDFYDHLAPIANRWNAMLNRTGSFPSHHDAFRRGKGAPPQLGRVLVNRLLEGGFHALHHDVDTEHGFPIQVVMMLSDPRTDFTGGELVMVEQRPRMQSRPMVLPLVKGSVALISAAHRPCKGANGHYRVSTRHAISRVHSGVRVCLELLFDF